MLLKNLNHVGLLMGMSEARAILPYDLPSIYIYEKQEFKHAYANLGIKGTRC
jgi:hypothetical protein